ncbi:MAG: hypothetical protein ACK521_09730 [bacterium]
MMRSMHIKSFNESVPLDLSQRSGFENKHVDPKLAKWVEEAITHPKVIGIMRGP